MSSLRIFSERIARAARRRDHLAGENPIEKAIEWVYCNRVPGAGIPPFPRNPVSFQEVTGYFIPTLLNFGEREMAQELARWEASVQRSDGAFSATDQVPYTFDTAQVMRGFLAVLQDLPEIEPNLRRAADYVADHIAADGEVLTPSYVQWMGTDGTCFSEYCNLYVLPPLLETGLRLSEPRYVAAAQRALNYFRKKPDLVLFKPQNTTNSHVFGYMMEGLAELGEFELAKRGLRQAAAVQMENGGIPIHPGVTWVCSTGIAQLAAAWYRCGEKGPADRAMAFLERLQNRSGGFYGSYGRGCTYFPNREISWAVKFFLDASLLQIKQDFNHFAGAFSGSIERDDGRVQQILTFFGDLNGRRVMDVGCGKGRYLRILQEAFPRAEFHGLDVSEEMLRSCPPGVVSRVGSMLNIEYPDAFFDGIYAVEALEHAVRVEPAIRDMIRVLRPGGKILIIDKNLRQFGALKTKSWERWFYAEELARLLRKYGVTATHQAVPYNKSPRPDGLFIAWAGVKETRRSSISGVY